MSDSQQYDVAISLLAKDESWASTRLLPALNKHIRGGIFLYSRRQEELANNGDLVTTFGRVFREGARVAVVLYRPEWGRTRFTGLEEEAIKVRKLNQGGVRSIYLVSMEPPAIPEWFPATEMYFDPEQWKPSAMAAQIALRVADAGGVVGPESALDRARRLRKAQRTREAREERLQTDGAAAYVNEIATFLGALKDHARLVSEDEPGDAVHFNELDRGALKAELRYRGCQLQAITSSLARTLKIRASRALIIANGYTRVVEDREAWNQEYEFAIDAADQWCWRRGREDASSSELAETLVVRLLELGHLPDELRRSDPRLPKWPLL